MPTPDLKNTIEKTQARVARLESRLAREKLKTRRADTRRKIELGGLVIKSKLADYPKAIILGAMVDALEQLERNDAGILELFRLKGERVFMEHTTP